MSWRTNPITIQIRSFARSIGLTGLIGNLIQGERYEQAFDDAMFANISSGDVVWDVGANVGYYSRKFAESAAPGGQVFAFEPFPGTIRKLTEQVADHSGITIVPVALGSEPGEMAMEEGGDDLGATNRVVARPSGKGENMVEIARGDTLVETGKIQMPNAVKIDTEGFELDVLRGMSQLLKTPELRALFVEIHFGNLAERGMANAPAEIEALLFESGFSINWVDPSHVVALRV